ncbi:hypothetical protein V1525DRAFT_401511 [Lipomyces kononenkoae]|uniref:Uncharacterized protein n=1 Tax=Lipomyces kononenkoae TaxID=34357 RepID=A0ACC3T2V4_LIPKO
MTQDQSQEDPKPSSPLRPGDVHLRPYSQIILSGKSGRAEARLNEDHESYENISSRDDSDELGLSATKSLDWDQLAMPKRPSSLAKHSAKHKKWKQAEILWEQSDADESMQNMNTSQLLSEGEKLNSTTRQTTVERPSQMADQLPSTDSPPCVWRDTAQACSPQLVLVQEEMLPAYVERPNSECQEKRLPEYEEKPSSKFQEIKEKLRLEYCNEKLGLKCDQTSITWAPAAPKKKKKKTIESSNKKSLGNKKSRSKLIQKPLSDHTQKSTVRSKKQLLPETEEQRLGEDNHLSTTKARDFVSVAPNQISDAEQFYLAREQALIRARCENDISAIKLKIWKGLLPEDPPHQELSLPRLEASQFADKRLKQKEKYEVYDENLLQASELPEDLAFLCGDHFALLRQALYLGWGSDECEKRLEQGVELLTGIKRLEGRYAAYFEQNEMARKFLTILDLRRKTYQKKLQEQRKISKLEQQLAAFNDAVEMLEQADAIISANDMCLRDQFHRLTLEMKEEIADRIYDWRQQRAHTYDNLKVIWHSIKENATAKLVNLTVAAMLPKKPKTNTIRNKVQQNVPPCDATTPASSKSISREELYCQLYKSFTQQRSLLEGEIIDRMQDVNILTHHAQDLRDVELQEKYNLLLLEAQRDLREVERLATNLEQQASEAANKIAESEQIEQLEKGRKIAADNCRISPIAVNC